jgi:hypothetical protein
MGSVDLGAAAGEAVSADGTTPDFVPDSSNGLKGPHPLALLTERQDEKEEEKEVGLVALPKRCALGTHDSRGCGKAVDCDGKAQDQIDVVVSILRDNAVLLACIEVDGDVSDDDAAVEEMRRAINSTNLALVLQLVRRSDWDRLRAKGVSLGLAFLLALVVLLTGKKMQGVAATGCLTLLQQVLEVAGLVPKWDAVVAAAQDTPQTLFTVVHPAANTEALVPADGVVAAGVGCVQEALAAAYGGALGERIRSIEMKPLGGKGVVLGAVVACSGSEGEGMDVVEMEIKLIALGRKSSLANSDWSSHVMITGIAGKDMTAHDPAAAGFYAFRDLARGSIEAHGTFHEGLAYLPREDGYFARAGDVNEEDPIVYYAHMNVLPSRTAITDAEYLKLLVLIGMGMACGEGDKLRDLAGRQPVVAGGMLGDHLVGFQTDAAPDTKHLHAYAAKHERGLVVMGPPAFALNVAALLGPNAVQQKEDGTYIVNFDDGPGDDEPRAVVTLEDVVALPFLAKPTFRDPRGPPPPPPPALAVMAGPLEEGKWKQLPAEATKSRGWARVLLDKTLTYHERKLVVEGDAATKAATKPALDLALPFLEALGRETLPFVLKKQGLAAVEVGGFQLRYLEAKPAAAYPMPGDQKVVAVATVSVDEHDDRRLRVSAERAEAGDLVDKRCFHIRTGGGVFLRASKEATKKTNAQLKLWAVQMHYVRSATKPTTNPGSSNPGGHKDGGSGGGGGAGAGGSSGSGKGKDTGPGSGSGAEDLDGNESESDNGSIWEEEGGGKEEGESVPLLDDEEASIYIDCGDFDTGGGG